MAIRNVVVGRLGSPGNGGAVEARDVPDPGPPSPAELEQINARSTAQARADTDVRDKQKLRKIIDHFEKEGLV